MNKNAEYLTSQGYKFLTDWTFTDLFPLQSMIKEGEDLITYYRKKGLNKFILNFTHNQHLDLWGKTEEDYSI